MRILKIKQWAGRIHAHVVVNLQTHTMRSERVGVCNVDMHTQTYPNWNPTRLKWAYAPNARSPCSQHAHRSGLHANQHDFDNEDDTSCALDQMMDLPVRNGRGRFQHKKSLIKYFQKMRFTIAHQWSKLICSWTEQSKDICVACKTNHLDHFRRTNCHGRETAGYSGRMVLEGTSDFLAGTAKAFHRVAGIARHPQSPSPTPIHTAWRSTSFSKRWLENGEQQKQINELTNRTRPAITASNVALFEVS